MSAAISPASSATPTPIMATKITATTLKLAKLGTNDEKMKRSAVDREQALDLRRLGVDLRLLVGVRGRRHLRLGLRPSRRRRLLDRDRRHLGDLVGDLMSNALSSAESRMTKTQSPAKIIAGCGTLLPSVSMRVEHPLVEASATAPAGTCDVAHVDAPSSRRVLAEELGLGDARPARTRRPARARSARGCWRSRPWCRAAGSRRRAPPRCSALTSGIEPPVATSHGLRRPRPWRAPCAAAS